MGKGDRKTRRGKIAKGTYGKHRMAKSTAIYIPKEIISEITEELTKKASVKIAESPAKAAVEKKAVKKPAAEKSVAEKPVAEKKAKPAVAKKETKPVAKASKPAEKKAKA